MQNSQKLDSLLKNKRLLFGIGAILALIIVAVLITSSLSSVEAPQRRTDLVTITDPATGRKMTFGKDGLVLIEDGNGNVITEVWDREKIAAFLAYINQTYGESDSYSIGFESDELINTISQGGEGDDPPDPITQYFATPTPPSGGGPGGGGGSTPPPGGGGGAPSWCKHWKLSYCADVPESSATPFPSYPPGVIVAEDCDDWAAAGVGYNTIISNFSCIEATPNP